LQWNCCNATSWLLPFSLKFFVMPLHAAWQQVTQYCCGWPCICAHDATAVVACLRLSPVNCWHLRIFLYVSWYNGAAIALHLCAGATCLPSPLVDCCHSYYFKFFLIKVVGIVAAVATIDCLMRSLVARTLLQSPATTYGNAIAHCWQHLLCCYGNSWCNGAATCCDTAASTPGSVFSCVSSLFQPLPPIDCCFQIIIIAIAVITVDWWVTHCWQHLLLRPATRWCHSFSIATASAMSWQQMMQTYHMPWHCCQWPIPLPGSVAHSHQLIVIVILKLLFLMNKCC